jgi:phage terminase large subunit-like protein
VVKTDEAGNIKPHKQNARDKIDGAIAMIMAVYRASLHENEVMVQMQLI